MQQAPKGVCIEQSAAPRSVAILERPDPPILSPDICGTRQGLPEHAVRAAGGQLVSDRAGQGDHIRQQRHTEDDTTDTAGGAHPWWKPPSRPDVSVRVRCHAGGACARHTAEGAFSPQGRLSVALADAAPRRSPGAYFLVAGPPGPRRSAPLRRRRIDSSANGANHITSRLSIRMRRPDLRAARSGVASGSAALRRNRPTTPRPSPTHGPATPCGA